MSPNARMEACQKDTTPEQVLAAEGLDGGEAVAYQLCSAAGSGSESPCERLPQKAGSASGLAAGTDPRLQCRANFRRVRFLQALGSGAPEPELAARLEAYVSVYPDNPKLDFKVLASELAQARREKRHPSKTQYPKEDFQFVLGLKACAKAGSEQRQAACAGSAAVLEAVAKNDPSLCAPSDRAACEGVLGGSAACESAGRFLVKAYCSRKAGLSKPGAAQTPVGTPPTGSPPKPKK